MHKISSIFLLALTIFSLIGFGFNSCSSVNDDGKKSADIIEGPVAAGCPDTKYPEWQSSKYVLPYPVGTAYEIDLSHCSGSYHSKDLPDKFAIDFDMPIGTIITASRSGQVVHVVESGIDGHQPNNLVVVDHGDGTYAEYMHLTNNGAYVSVGNTIARGDTIGLSGSTGLAGYPHLHFVVAVNSWQWPYESVPATFSNTLSNERSLASGTVYEAFPY
jgi:hypothetical protein